MSNKDYYSPFYAANRLCTTGIEPLPPLFSRLLRLARGASGRRRNSVASPLRRGYIVIVVVGLGFKDAL